jgi:hypothetical protein
VETSGPFCGDKEAGGGSRPLLSLMLRLTTCGTVLPIPPYTLMAWCLGLVITLPLPLIQQTMLEMKITVILVVMLCSLLITTSVLEEPAASIFRLEEWVFTCFCTRLHGITSQKTVIFVVTT